MIDLKNVRAAYSKKEVLHGISTSFETGKLTSIIGPNGCGKSTLLKTIVGIMRDFDGEISIDGENLKMMKRKDAAKRIAYLAQGKGIPDMTVSQMVLHGRFPHLSYPRRYRNCDREIACAAMEKMGILHLGDMPVSSLSGGMRQNAYIAMALAQETDYIILDEPTAYLDIAHQLELMKILRDLKGEGKGIITVMHDLPIAFTFSDSILVMNEGNVVCSGTPSEICKTDMTKKIFGIKLNSDNDEYFYRLSDKYEI